MKYKATKDLESGRWLVERIEPFFDLPMVLGMFRTREAAHAVVRQIRANGIPHHIETTMGADIP